jgi:hypothetical protein
VHNLEAVKSVEEGDEGYEDLKMVTTNDLIAIREM